MMQCNCQRLLCFLGLSIFLLSSCDENQVLLPGEYVKWVTDASNGLCKSKRINEFNFMAQYKPLDFIVAQEEKTNRLSKSLLKTRKKELGTGYVYYNFRIKNEEGNLSPVGAGANSDHEYQRRLGYFTFDMQQDLYLLHGQDTFPCTFFQFVRTYDVAPYVEFALGFKKEEKTIINQDITFVFEDKVLGIGTTKLLFEEHLFKNIPKIKTLEP